MFNDRRKAALPSADTLAKTYGTNLPGAVGKKRSVEQWEARASVLAAGRAGSIKAAPKTKGGLTGRVVKENKQEFAKRQMNYARKGK